MFKKDISKKTELYILGAILIFTSLVYLNHFDNGFYFDDYHTISNNKSIRNLKNIPEFFTNGKTFSSLPTNQAYRPMITLMNAIDYNMGEGLKPVSFHLHIFFWFLVLIILLFFLSKHLYLKSNKSNQWTPYMALFATAWFALHTANAETINYICARSDSFSTLAIVASLLLYISNIGRKYYLYIFTMIIGIWTKQTGVMFFPILVVYVLLYKENDFLSDFSFKKIKKNSLKTLMETLPTGIISISLFSINQFYLTPSTTWSTNTSISRFEYISTQLYVYKHYLSNFILPINLSADPDIGIIKPWYDYRILLGLAIVLLLLFIMAKTAMRKELRPVSFGIAWFFIALIPTTFNPLGQVANDHRVFFPFIGLFIALPCLTVFYIKKYNLIETTKNFNFKLIIVTALIIISHSIGTFQRNRVWDNSTSLWKDVTIKSPNNGRGLMNYGIALLREGDHKAASMYFEKSLKILPNYSTLHTSIGLLHGATKNHKKANQFFKSGIKLSKKSDPKAYYFYAQYLANNKQYKEAIPLLVKAISLSTNYDKPQALLKQIIDNKNITLDNKKPSMKENLSKIIEEIKKKPSYDLFIKLGSQYSKLSNYKKSNEIYFTALKIRPNASNKSQIYDKICANYNNLKQWDKAIQACKKALKINPKLKSAKNNMAKAKPNLKP